MSASFAFPPSFRRSVIAIVATVVVFAFVPLMAGSFALHVLTISFYFVILASSWNLLAGYTGQFSLAHHAFAAIGAYTSGLLGYHYGIPAWIGIPSGVAMAALFGLILGRLVLSVQPLYGNVNPLPYYFPFLALAALVLIGLRALIDSPLGYYMRAIKDDELRAKSLGIDTTRVKIAVFSISSAIAGLAGAFYGHFIVLLSPQMIDFSEMAKIVIMVVIGGFGTFLGPVIGAAPVQMVMTYLQKYG